MALPLILGLLGSSLGAGTALGAVGAGALASGVGRFLETGDLEEGLKTGATSFIGGQALGTLGKAFGGAGASPVADAARKAVSTATTNPTFGQQLMATASDPVALGQATLAQASVPPPTPRKPDPVEFENRQAGIPRNVDRRPPPDYRPGYDGEFDYGITPNYGVGLMSKDDPLYMSYGGLVNSRIMAMGQPRRMDYQENRHFPMGRRTFQSGLDNLGRDISGRVENRTQEEVQEFVGDVDNMAQERFDVNLSEPSM